jgi:hypothetical protein
MAKASVLTRVILFLLLLQEVSEKRGLKRKTAMVRHYYKLNQAFAFKVIQYTVKIHAAGRFPGAAAGGFFLFIQPEAIIAALGNAGTDENPQFFGVHHSIVLNLSQQRLYIHVTSRFS